MFILRCEKTWVMLIERCNVHSIYRRGLGGYIGWLEVGQTRYRIRGRIADGGQGFLQLDIPFFLHLQDI